MNWVSVLKVTVVYPTVVDMGYGKMCANIIFGNLLQPALLADCVIGFIAGTFGATLLIKDLRGMLKEGNMK